MAYNFAIPSSKPNSSAFKLPNSSPDEQVSRLKVNDRRENDQELFQLLKKPKRSSQARSSKIDENAFTLGSGLAVLSELKETLVSIKELKQKAQNTSKPEDIAAINQEISSKVSSFNSLKNSDSFKRFVEIAKTISERPKRNSNASVTADALKREENIVGTEFISAVRHEDNFKVDNIARSLQNVQNINLFYDGNTSTLLIADSQGNLNSATDKDIDNAISLIEQTEKLFSESKGISGFLDLAHKEYSNLGKKEEQEMIDLGKGLRQNIINNSDMALAAIAHLERRIKDPLIVA